MLNGVVNVCAAPLKNVYAWALSHRSNDSQSALGMNRTCTVNEESLLWVSPPHYLSHVTS